MNEIVFYFPPDKQDISEAAMLRADWILLPTTNPNAERKDDKKIKCMYVLYKRSKWSK